MGAKRLEWMEVEWQGLGRQGSNGCQRLRWMDGRATPLARLWVGWAWGCDEFTVGPGGCDTHGEVLGEEDGSGGCLPGGPRAGRLGAWGVSVSRKGREGAGRREGARPEVARRHAEGSVDGSGAGGDQGEEGERGWGTHCQAFMAR